MFIILIVANVLYTFRKEHDQSCFHFENCNIWLSSPEDVPRGSGGKLLANTRKLCDSTPETKINNIKREFYMLFSNFEEMYFVFIEILLHIVLFLRDEQGIVKRDHTACK